MAAAPLTIADTSDAETLGRDGGQAAATESCTLVTYYNGACPVCRTGIHGYRDLAQRLGRRDLAWLDIASEPELLAPLGLEVADVRRRLHVIDDQGRIHIGVDAFAALWETLPRRRWLARIIRAPGIHAVSAFLYDRGLAPALDAWNRWRQRRAQAARGSS